MEDLIKGVFASSLGIKLEEVDALIEASEDGTIENVDGLKTALVDRKKQLEKETFGRAFKEANKKYESFVSDSGFQNDEGLQGIDLVKSFYENKTLDNSELETMKTENERLLEQISSKSDADPKLTKEYIEVQNTVKSLQEAIPLKIEQARKEERDTFAKTLRVNAIKKMISDDIINSDLYELPTEPIKRANTLSKLVLNEFSGYDFIVPENVQSLGDVQIVTQDDSGKKEKLKDEFGELISLKSLVDSVANSNLLEKIGKARTPSANGQINPSGRTNFKTTEEIVRNESLSPQEKREALAAFRNETP